MVILSFTNNTRHTVFYHHKIRLFGHCLDAPSMCQPEHHYTSTRKVSDIFHSVFPVIWVEAKIGSNANKSCFKKPAPAGLADVKQEAREMI